MVRKEEVGAVCGIYGGEVKSRGKFGEKNLRKNKHLDALGVVT